MREVKSGKKNSLGLLFIFSAILGMELPQSAAKADDQGVIEYSRNSGFGLTLSFGKRGPKVSASVREERMISFPISSSIGSGVLINKSGFKYEFKKARKHSNSKLEIKYPDLKLKGYPEKGKSKNYLFSSIAENGDTQITILSMLCAGHSVVAVEHFKGTLQEMSQYDSKVVSDTTFIATGAAANNNRRGNPSLIFGSSTEFSSGKQQGTGPIISNHIPGDVWEKISKNDNAIDALLNAPNEIEIDAPSILIGTSMSVSVASFQYLFRTLPTESQNSLLNKVCSSTFEKIYEKHDIANMPKTFGIENYNVEQSVGKILFKNR